MKVSKVCYVRNITLCTNIPIASVCSAVCLSRASILSNTHSFMHICVKTIIDRPQLDIIRTSAQQLLRRATVSQQYNVDMSL